MRRTSRRRSVSASQMYGRISSPTPQRARSREPTPHLDPASLEGLAYDSLFKQLCGKGQLKTSTADRVLAPFGFVSVLAGVMLAIEIAVRTGNIAARAYNYWRMSPWGAPIARMRELRSRRSDCEFCGNKTLQLVVKQLWE